MISNTAKNDTRYDELWYRRLIAKAIIFRKLEVEVQKQPWYEGDYRANIVTYSMAKVFHDASGEKQVLDIDTIWRRQAVPDALQRALLVGAAEANDVITHPPTGVQKHVGMGQAAGLLERSQESQTRVR